MVVLALSSVLLMTAVMLFNALLKSQRQFSLRERQRREYARIEALLRSDVHAARSATAKADSCELRGAGGESWTWLRLEEQLLRVRSKGGAAGQRESFQLHADAKLDFRVSSAGKRTWLNVTIEPPPASGPAKAPATPFRGKFLVGGLVPEVGEEKP